MGRCFQLLLCKHQVAAIAAAREGTLETQPRSIYRPPVQNSELFSQNSRKIPCSAIFKLSTNICGFGFLVYTTAVNNNYLKTENA